MRSINNSSRVIIGSLRLKRKQLINQEAIRIERESKARDRTFSQRAKETHKRQLKMTEEGLL
jgi:hypothetical protein